MKASAQQWAEASLLKTKMESEELVTPKVFMSYSWTSPEHERWVLKLAEELTASGIEVLLDKWDLREGADKHVFMERSVTDSTVTKVLMICDKAYAEKANGRRGGVGTEAQIITPELYNQIEPDSQSQKFVPIVTELNEMGAPWLPQFLKSRIYVDMSDPQEQANSFEQLIRAIYDKPTLQRPELGKTPAFLLADEKINLGTGSRFTRAHDAISTNKDFAVGALDDYLHTFAENLESFRIRPDDKTPYDELVVESISSFRTYRDEIVDLFSAVGRYRSDAETYIRIHSFFESLLKYAYRPLSGGPTRDTDFDNFKFMVEEIFIYATAVFIKNRRFGQLNELLERGYYVPPNYPYPENVGLLPFSTFKSHLETLRNRNIRLSSRRVSLKADLSRVNLFLFLSFAG